MVRKASAVARRTCGAALLAIHAASGGAAAYVPGTRRKREPYRMWESSEAVGADEIDELENLKARGACY